MLGTASAATIAAGSYQSVLGNIAPPLKVSALQRVKRKKPPRDQSQQQELRADDFGDSFADSRNGSIASSDEVVASSFGRHPTPSGVTGAIGNAATTSAGLNKRQEFSLAEITRRNRVRANTQQAPNSSAAAPVVTSISSVSTLPVADSQWQSASSLDLTGTRGLMHREDGSGGSGDFRAIAAGSGSGKLEETFPSTSARRRAASVRDRAAPTSPISSESLPPWQPLEPFHISPEATHLRFAAAKNAATLASRAGAAVNSIMSISVQFMILLVVLLGLQLTLLSSARAALSNRIDIQHDETELVVYELVADTELLWQQSLYTKTLASRQQSPSSDSSNEETLLVASKASQALLERKRQQTAVKLCNVLDCEDRPPEMISGYSTPINGIGATSAAAIKKRLLYLAELSVACRRGSGGSGGAATSSAPLGQWLDPSLDDLLEAAARHPRSGKSEEETSVIKKAIDPKVINNVGPSADDDLVASTRKSIAQAAHPIESPGTALTADASRTFASASRTKDDEDKSAVDVETPIVTRPPPTFAHEDELIRHAAVLSHQQLKERGAAKVQLAQVHETIGAKPPAPAPGSVVSSGKIVACGMLLLLLLVFARI